MAVTVTILQFEHIKVVITTNLQFENIKPEPTSALDFETRAGASAGADTQLLGSHPMVFFKTTTVQASYSLL